MNAAVRVGGRDVVAGRGDFIRGGRLRRRDGGYDELGGGIDAVHVRCEVVLLPPATR